MPKNRVTIIVNKWWECDPVVNAFLHQKVRPKGVLDYPDRVSPLRPRPNQGRLPAENFSPQPRLVYELSDSVVELWCLSDLMEHHPDTNDFQSSTERKSEVLPRVFVNREPSLVVAVGTAGYPSEVSYNWCVACGTAVFIIDGHPDGENAASRWHGGRFNSVIESTLTPSAFRSIVTVSDEATSKFARTPNKAAETMAILSEWSRVSLGFVNVTNYQEYQAMDDAAEKGYSESGYAGLPSSVETTHGLIRSISEAPFMFVSGISDRAKHFAEDVTPNEYSQNMVASHNAGVALTYMVANINQHFRG